MSLPDDVYQTFRKSIYRHWKFTKFSESAGFGAVFLAFMGNHITTNNFEISKNIIEEDLRRMPISQINWSFDVTPGKNRFDLHWDPYLDRFERVGNRITEPLKKDEQGF